jgi:branched-chain amino acid transport system substrate-binding protein
MTPRTRRAGQALTLVAGVTLLMAACVESGSDGEDAASPGAEEPEETDEPESDPAADAPEEIVIGNVIAMSGPNNAGASLTQIPSYDLWAEDVNAEGGIYVAEYDTRIPVRIERVDDTSDIGTATQLVQQMLESGDVDFILPPWGTAFNVAIAPIVSEYESPVIGCTLSSAEMAADPGVFPYFYTMLNQPAEQGTELVEILVELEVESVAVIHHDDLHGIEVADVVLPALEEAGIEVPVHQTYPVNSEDLSQQLREAQAADVDGLLAFSYPPETFLMAGQMQEIGFNPDLFYATVGVAFPAFRDANGVEAVEGVMGAGAWNPNVDIEGARGYFDRHVEMHGAEPDRWASAACYATGQVLGQAIEAAGTLDPQAVKEAMDTTEFNTILGSFTFEDNFNPVYPGEVGQWQDGEFEIVGPAENRTSDPIYPKPSWPGE